MTSRLSCTTCRGQKRRCSRELPSCELCRKNKRRCEYPPDSPSMAPESGHVFSPGADVRSPFPALLFLDSYTFRKQRSQVQPPEINLPRKFLNRLESADQMSRVANFYFESVHAFFPIVSKLRTQHNLSRLVVQPSADTVLLLLAMRLVTQSRRDETTRSLYELTKKCYSYIEQSNLFTLKLLQSGLLIALYEIGHAIFPAAYLTIRNCANVGHALGVHTRNPSMQILPPAKSWTEHEESRRAWWGVVILDRYISIGTGSSIFACKNPKPDDLLPVDETSWDQGEPALIQSLAVSASTSIPASPFTRTCQAAHLLSRIVRHINDMHDDAPAYYREAKQFHHIISAFDNALSHELDSISSTADPILQIKLFTAIALCFSAKIALYDHYTCAEVDATGGIGTPEQLGMQQVALENIKTTCIAVHTFAQKILLFSLGNDTTFLSPLLCNCLYQAAMSYTWYIRETGQTDLHAHLREIVDALRLIGARWGVANEYLKVLENGNF
ncbi:hypothetical protein K469DRAFT_722435 [Zopfia rhizophila CBS 207.26]|uniref:Zn(2)-C6 fungal-type domain-containing protein n=1 Tax=Zopfia rhizophila CBS 207.26 TaxID=1314779 RepID=A0A6A6EWH7_9PEZI|nr:hypothetical protein K469DRAFT_722435 [Zopfia rhizophila CBS 207.26]